MQKLKRNYLLSSKLAWAIWRILVQELKNLKNLRFKWAAFDQSILCFTQKRTRELCLIALNILMQKLKENWLLLSKMTCGIWQIFTRALLTLKTGTLIGFFCPKLKIFELKICRGVIHHENEEWCKTGIGNDMSFQNWDEDFDEF